MKNDRIIDADRAVLVVDDNAANIFVLSTMLKKIGFLVDEATSGMEAINLTCQKEYDLILMDHLMPEMDGIQTIKQILFISKGEKRPVIIGASATVDAEVVNAFRDVGADDVMEKPVTMERLEEKLSQFDLCDIKMIKEERIVENEDIDHLLSTVQGLDYHKGIELMAGSIENYMKVLLVCVKNIKDNLNSIHMLEDTSQMDSFALYFHSLKGIFLNIGADVLAEESRSLEMAAKGNRYEDIESALDVYMREVQTFDEELQTVCERYQKKRQEQFCGEVISETEYAKELGELRDHIADFEYIEITETLEKMLMSTNGAEKSGLEKVSLAIQEFDYDEALQLVDALREAI